MQVRFRAKAIADLDKIIQWYDKQAPESTQRIVDDIERAIRRLQQFPHSGPTVGLQDLRRIVTLRYHFKIAYRAMHNSIEIIGIFRFQDRSH